MADDGWRGRDVAHRVTSGEESGGLVERLDAVLQARVPAFAERDEPYWEAAVALVIREQSGTPELLFIERATRDGDPWSGQVALPGGRRDEREMDLVETAVRETREETGIDLRTQGRVLGPLDEMRPRNPMLPPFIVRPYVAALHQAADVVHSDEVVGHFWAPVAALFDPRNTRETRVNGRGVTMWREAIHYEGRVIWGLTERILRAFHEVAR